MPGTELVWILKLFVLPPGILVLLGVAGLARGCRRLSGGFLLVFSLSGLYLLSTPFIADRLMSLVETYPVLTDREILESKAQAIVVLGGGRWSDAAEYGGDTVNPGSLQRLRYAAWLSRKTGLPVIPSGGSTESGRRPEAEIARQLLEQEFGVEVIAVEAASRTTWENGVMTAELLDRLSLGPVLLVTHGMHMPRAVEVFRRAGVEVIPAPTALFHKAAGQQRLTDWLPKAKALLKSHDALHEILGRIWYSMNA
ncbi:MAG: YdcF family protein [Gammaproteobacteria bacterium]|nr:YdcF family protein [Gammaproteobacteria bacterium]